MLTAEARVSTARSSGYLVQLCRHFDHEAQSHPEVQAQIEWSDDRGVASFGWGRCTLRAEPRVLILRAEGSDEEGLRRVQHLVADHLERLATGDDLMVAWSPAQNADEQSATPAPGEDNADG